MAIKIDAARLLTWRAGWMAMNGIPLARGEGSMAKLFAGDMAMASRSTPCRSLAATATSRTTRSRCFMRDAKIYQIWEGTAEIQRLVISRYVLGERTATAARPRVVHPAPPEAAAAGY